MKYLIPFLYNNVKSATCTGGNIRVLYFSLEIIESPTNLTPSGQCSLHFDTSSYTNNDAETFHSVVASLRVLHNTAFEC